MIIIWYHDLMYEIDYQVLMTSLNFWPPWTIPMGNLATTKKGQNLGNQKSHANQIWFPCVSGQPLLAWIFWADSIFWPPWTIVHGPKGNFGRFWRQGKRSHNSETGGAPPTKIGFHAFQVNLYLHEFFKLILFFDPHGL